MDLQLRPNHQTFVDRFVKACQADERVAAALLVGSYAKDRADAHSDLDLYLITTDDFHRDLIGDRSSFIHGLGEPLFMEDFDLPDIVFLIFPDDSEVEISFGRESQLSQILNEPFKVLLDKKNIVTGIVPQERQLDPEEQTEKLRRLIYWFWHELSHFMTAMGRGQLWWARGQLEALRSICVNLARLRHNFLDPDIGEEAYFKIEKAMPIDQLSTLKETFCPMEKEAMLKAGLVILGFYQDLAPALAELHGIQYPRGLERLMIERLQKLQSGG